MKTIAKAVVAEYNKEFNSDKVKDLERQIAKLNRDLDKYIEMLLDISQSARSRIYKKMETIEMQKTDLEIDLSKLRIANQIRYTEAEIVAWVAWLKQFCKGDLSDVAFRRKIIDTFINSVYVYDDRIVIFYNIRIRGGKQVSYTDMLDTTGSCYDERLKPCGFGNEIINTKKRSDTAASVQPLNSLAKVTQFDTTAPPGTKGVQFYMRVCKLKIWIPAQQLAASFRLQLLYRISEPLLRGRDVPGPWYPLPGCPFYRVWVIHPLLYAGRDDGPHFFHCDTPLTGQAFK